MGRDLGPERFEEDARKLVEDNSLEAIAKHLEGLVQKNEFYRRGQCINLVASDSALSPLAEKLLRSDLSRRGAFGGGPGDRHSRGAKYFDEIEAITLELGRRLFRCEFVDPSPLSGSFANAIAIRSLTEAGQTALVPEKPVGHYTAREEGFMGYRGVRVVNLPFDYREFNVDLERFSIVASEVKPSLIVVGSSLMLFPPPLKEMVEILQGGGGKILYDGAHVLGLVAGGKFQDPLREGAYVVTGSTQKTLSGPLGGIILYDDANLHERLKPVVKGHVSTPGYERFAALAVTFAEILSFGAPYADQTIRNAKSLARALDSEGFKVVGKEKGYTESHIVLLDGEEFGGGRECVEKLENANIIATMYSAGTRDWKFEGVRFGVAEETRRGMKEGEMKEIANLIRRIIVDGESKREIQARVAELRRSFDNVHYCFDGGRR